MTPELPPRPAHEADLLTRLQAHRTLGEAPRSELEWLASHGQLRTYAVGEVATRKGQPEQWLQIMLTGHLAAHVYRGAAARRLIGWRGGDVCGLLPYSRGGKPPGDTVAEEPTEMLVVHRDHFPEMIRACPEVTATLVHAMLDRARYFTSSDLHDEKLLSLGRLAAGLAHELNNPASAAARSVRLLEQALADTDASARALQRAGLSDAQWACLEGVRALAAPRPGAARRSALERADREEALTSWLEDHHLDSAFAASLVDGGVTPAALDTLAAALSAEALAAAVRSVSARGALRSLTGEIEVSVSRIHQLVAAIKGFSYMDRAPTLEPTDVRRGLTDTLTVLGAKTRAKAVRVEVELAADLPRVPAFGGELNQVWANLLDNALDAVAESGTIRISARSERNQVVVSIVDDGPGIAAEIQDRIFDPFFTTKPIGSGTGLGLDIVRRLVERHQGQIELSSRPGCTEFRVTLPIESPASRP